MRVISIDVGIKNLAYCILEGTTLENNALVNKYKILHWDVINLCGEEHVCNCPLKEKVKKGKKGKNIMPESIANIQLCNKKASFIKGEQYFCQTHAKKSAYLLPNSSLKGLKSWKREVLVSYAKAQGIVFPEDTKKEALLKLVTTYVGEKTLEKISAVSANEMTLIQMGIQLVKDFDRVLGGDAISALDKIVIENQISPIANRMKTLQGMIAQYFIMRGNARISFISSANKLKMFTNTDISVTNISVTDTNINTGKTTYGERKKAGVNIVKDLLVNDTAWLPVFLTHKKKDDLADAFLQGIWFLSKLNKI
jgi:hypothetical protein